MICVFVAVNIFASVGQRKYQIDEQSAKGSVPDLVGRNDIISRYIYMKTDRYRSRKQVSSHIQVWAHCKKPPSSRDMTMDGFNELQTVLRMHYSRPNTAFGQPKKKLRRVVSTSNVSTAKRRAGIDSLGLHSAVVTSQPSPDSRANERKRNIDATSLDHPSKRCRRVVSELPPTSLSSLFENGCDGSSLDYTDASSASFWLTDYVDSTGSLVTSDQPSVHQLVIPQAGSVDMGLPLLLPPFDAHVQDSPSVYELSMAAMAGFEEALSSNMVHATECMPLSPTLRDSSFDSILTGLAPAFHDGAIQPF
ncbi:hypothetical protein GGI21_005433, partial [Coemansia aciculifera]